MSHSWFRRIAGKSVSAQRLHCCRPQLELLEDRRLLSLLPAVNYPDGINSPAGFVAVGDLRGNGIPDIVTTEGFGDYRLSVFLGNGDGTFQPPAIYLAGDGVVGVRIADLRGNGIPDIITANDGAGFGDSGTNTVSVLLGNGDGTFQHKRDYYAGPGGPLDLVVADLRGNGILDIATVNEFAGTVNVLLGNGDGTFQPPVSYPVGIRPQHIAAGRFGGDSAVPDLAVTDHDSGMVSVLVNHGDGTFRQHVDYPVGSEPFGITLGDFANNGNLDIAVANYQSNSVSILMGNGDHTFQPARNIAVPGGPNSLVAADFNNDGNLDLAVTVEASGSRVSLLLGDGTGNFAAPLNFATDLDPLGIAAADLTNDGSADLVTANVVGRSASVLLNDGSWDTAPRRGPTARGTADQSLALAVLPAIDRQGTTSRLFAADVGQLPNVSAFPADSVRGVPEAGTNANLMLPASPTDVFDPGTSDLPELDLGILDRPWSAISWSDDPHGEQPKWESQDGRQAPVDSCRP
jgi:hypothetical protein